jgi:hypothetical protein
VAIGATAIGTTATLKSITIIITTRTTILTRTSIDREGIGNTIRNTGEMRHMAIEEQRTSSVAMRVSSPGVAAEPVVRVGLVELAAQVAREALAELAVQVVPEGLVGLEELVDRVAREALVEPAVLVVQAAREALVELVVQVAPAELVVPAVELGLNREAGPELDLVEVELAHAPVAVPPVRTRSVIAAHHRALAAVLRAEDSAVVAEITRELAATEAVTAWAAAE